MAARTFSDFRHVSSQATDSIAFGLGIDPKDSPRPRRVSKHRITWTKEKSSMASREWCWRVYLGLVYTRRTAIYRSYYCVMYTRLFKFEHDFSDFRQSEECAIRFAITFIFIFFQTTFGSFSRSDSEICPKIPYSLFEDRKCHSS